MIYAEILLTARHTDGYGDLSMRHTPACCCLMVRHTPYFACLTMRHTPAFGHPSPRGDGAAARHLLIINNQNNAAAHPLSERGGRRPGCVALSNLNKLMRIALRSNSPKTFLCFISLSLSPSSFTPTLTHSHTSAFPHFRIPHYHPQKRNGNGAGRDACAPVPTLVVVQYMYNSCTILVQL